jgi:protein-L-isoaspartate(D-aspartate) O-methyltransferase
VASIDIDADLIDAARTRLRDLSYSPTLASADGAAGYAEAAPYDRIIATCSMPRIPPAWITQTNPGGLILASLHRELGGGPLALLTVTGGQASGHFLPFSGGFMPTRTLPHVSAVNLLQAHQDDDGTQQTTAIGATVLDDDMFGMFAALRLPAVQRLGLLPADSPEQTWLLGQDGSWAYQSGSGGPVTQDGPMKLWDHLENVYRDWIALGRPHREEFGLTVTAAGEHLLWHKTPNGPTWAI